eukprot:3832243-Prymnesium_polylepis.1
MLSELLGVYQARFERNTWCLTRVVGGSTSTCRTARSTRCCRTSFGGHRRTRTRSAAPCSSAP